MFEYKVDDVTVYTATAFDMATDSDTDIVHKIADWIVEHLERDILLDVLSKNYEGFLADERRRIIEKAGNGLEGTKNERKKYIENRLKEYFSFEYRINILGFVRFRLKDYRKSLEKIIDDAVDKYLCEKEYYEFIDMIKEYVSLQKPLVSALHIVTEENCVRYFDKYGTELTEFFDREYSFETDLSSDDRLLTILVLAAPEKIIWHNSNKVKNKELKTTIGEIFGASLVLCDNCKICINNLKNSIDNF